MPSAPRWSASARILAMASSLALVHRLGQDLQFLVLRPPSDLQANVIDRRSDHEAKRLEPGLAEQHVLRARQVGGENARRIGAGGGAPPPPPSPPPPTRPPRRPPAA